ncbi:hypothetical protein FACS189426_21400 [Bacteroidia bacterium]|nr:hypothetical protein FACS189426_21400 [Bacteroidia bacterium]
MGFFGIFGNKKGSSPQEKVEKAKEYHGKADNYRDKGEYDKAIEYYKKGLRITQKKSCPK